MSTGVVEDNLPLHPPPGSSILVSTAFHPPAGLQDGVRQGRPPSCFNLPLQLPPHLLYLVLSTRTPPISFLLFIRIGPLKLVMFTLSCNCLSKGSE